MSKLIIIRGNSGSGKSTVAKLVREKSAHPEKVALIEQDYLRRIVLKEKERDNGFNIELIKQTAIFALERGYDVIVEGILSSKRYGIMMRELMSMIDESYIFYIDIPFDETLRRHKTKPNAHEFGEKEMREWYREKDVLGVEDEIVFNEKFNQVELVSEILKYSGI